MTGQLRELLGERLGREWREVVGRRGWEDSGGRWWPGGEERVGRRGWEGSGGQWWGGEDGRIVEGGAGKVAGRGR